MSRTLQNNCISSPNKSRDLLILHTLDTENPPTLENHTTMYCIGRHDPDLLQINIESYINKYIRDGAPRDHRQKYDTGNSPLFVGYIDV